MNEKVKLAIKRQQLARNMKKIGEKSNYSAIMVKSVHIPTYHDVPFLAAPLHSP